MRSIIDYVCFFQAEDGIRYLVRSRGLGDVYKRQIHPRLCGSCRVARHHAHKVRQDAQTHGMALLRMRLDAPRVAIAHDAGAVSYTHLTLPTSDLV